MSSKNAIIKNKESNMLINAVIEKDEYGYFAYAPTLEGCVSQGDTYDEAIANIKEAIELYVESLSKSEIEHINNQSAAIVPIQVNQNARL
jgi:predicted RNase H-like HicB family nuclease